MKLCPTFYENLILKKKKKKPKWIIYFNAKNENYGLQVPKAQTFRSYSMLHRHNLRVVSEDHKRVTQWRHVPKLWRYFYT